MDNNKNTASFSEMKNLYPVTKTVAFQLRPMGPTRRHLAEAQVIEKDEAIYKDYVTIKGAADAIHRAFIEEILTPMRLKYVSDGAKDSLQEYAAVFADNKDEEREQKLEKIAMGLKAKIGEAFKKAMFDEKTTMLEAMSGRALFIRLLPESRLDAEQEAARSRLMRFTTIMGDYNKHRARIYDPDQKGFTIPRRIVDENLPIHLGNVNRAAKIPQNIYEKCDGLFDLVAAELPAAFCITDVFTTSGYTALCAQAQIDAYNTLIGGVSANEITKIKGLNEYIKEYNDHTKGEKLPYFKKLKKQILSEGTTLSWLASMIEKDEEAVEVIRQVEELTNSIPMPDADLLKSTDPALVHVHAKRLDVFSNLLLGDWNTVKDSIKDAIRTENPKSARMGDKGYAKKIDKLFKEHKSFSLQEIYDALKARSIDGPAAFAAFVDEHLIKTRAEVVKTRTALDGRLSKLRPGEKLAQEQGEGDKNTVPFIKDFLDAVGDCRRNASLFTDTDGEKDYNPDFYENAVDAWYENGREIIATYSSLKNYLTKKPFSTKKTQLRFSCNKYLEGWDINKERDYQGILLAKGKDLFVGVTAPKSHTLFMKEGIEDPQSPFQKIEVKNLPQPFKALPKRAFPPTELTRLGATPEVLALREKKTKDLTPDEVRTMVDFYKDIIRKTPDWDVFNFKFKDSSEYRVLNDFFNDVEAQNYVIWRRGIREQYIRDAVEDGSLYLFRITCQDMHRSHHGKTGTYKAILDEFISERNMKDPQVRLAGGAAVYYRKPSLERKVTHRAGMPMVNKNPDNPRRTRTLPFDLIKDKRYTEERFMIHIPVIIAQRADADGQRSINHKVQEVIRATPDMPVLGINRGTRNLITIAVTAPDGTILEQRNLNVFDGFDYRRKMDECGTERQGERRSWSSIRDIANVKKGYLSRVIAEVVTLQKKYNCVIALEKLDLEFRNRNQRFESNVYRQFERDIVRKFGCVLDKEDPDRMRNMKQLTVLGKTEEDRLKYTQNGIVFLVNPYWITRTDPVTGFINRIDTHFETIEKAENFIGCFESIKYNPATDRFEFSFKYEKLCPEQDIPDASRIWKVETYGDRIENIPDPKAAGHYIDKMYDLTVKFKKLLDDESIDYADMQNIQEKLAGRKADFYKEFLHLLRLTLQNTSWDSETREWRLVGCTADNKGKFFDTRNAPERLPKDADVNAAWNLARKCHIMLKNIREYDYDNPPKDEKGKTIGINLFVSDEQWYKRIK